MADANRSAGSVARWDSRRHLHRTKKTATTDTAIDEKTPAGSADDDDHAGDGRSDGAGDC